MQVSIALFSGAVETFFAQKWLSPLEKKLARTPMAFYVPTSKINFNDTVTVYLI